MSKQELVVLGQDDTGGCCPALLTTPLAEGQAETLAKVFKALGDPVRLRLLSMIASRAGGEVCVCDLTPAFDLSQPTISHHLKLLRQAGLIASERRGTWVYYRLLPEMTDRLAQILTRPAGQPPTATATTGAAS
ncbi:MULTISPECIES: ArsR/SmtB family transcription factor [Streptomyces]|uniref:ArsR/SmtB family transcription factor n=1 Tax=Streptomyces ardesiacus TaxID=285564 RepID=A0ABW8HIM1_9ACTN|nr:metalloregulator ArsR/SmtB family transcription factor [Streptomyces ardesiacus]MCL7366764.1 metalloregulator ArsR/SmtB family transcription factor [Streptomyces ardesiacus]NEB63146.1 helix-turn-helix transcriptional regulator [Streptomyces diastaticus]